MAENPLLAQLRAIAGFETHLGVPALFFERLLREDDWSFVIKLHALIEAATTNVLVEVLNTPELRDHFARVPLSDVEYGKLSLLKALDIGTSRERGFIRKLSEIRNQLVHNVQHTSFTLKNLAAEAPKAKRVALANVLGFALQDLGGERLRLLAQRPKELIWLSGLTVINCLALYKQLHVNKNRLVQLGHDALDVITQMSNSRDA
jgi:hypothetical protein